MRKYGSRLWRSGSVTTVITRTRLKHRNAFLPSTLTSKKTRCVCVYMHAHNQRLERCLTLITSLPTSMSMHVRNYALDHAYRYQTGSWMCANATGALLLKALEASGRLKTWRITSICRNYHYSYLSQPYLSTNIYIRLIYFYACICQRL